jgi:hypothetical protein
MERMLLKKKFEFRSTKLETSTNVQNINALNKAGFDMAKLESRRQAVEIRMIKARDSKPS